MKFKLNNKKELIVFVILGIFLMLNSVPTRGYKIDVDKTPKTPVHQYITNESQNVWSLIPQEIKDNIGKNDK